MDWLRRNWPDLAIGVALVAVIAGIIATLLTGGSFFPLAPSQAPTQADTLPPRAPATSTAEPGGGVRALPPDGATQPGDAVAGATPAGEAPDASTPADQAAPPEAAPSLAAPAPAAPGQATPTATVTPLAPDSPPPAATPPAATAPAATAPAATAPAATAPAATAPAPTAPAATPPAVTPTAPPAAAAPGALPTASGDPEAPYRVAVGAYTSAENAERQAAAFREAGYPVFTGVQGDLTIVLVGPYESESAAEQVSARVRTGGFGIEPVVYRFRPDAPTAAASTPSPAPAAPAPGAPTVSATATPAPSTAAVAAPTPTAGGRYLQVGAYGSVESSNPLRDRLAGLGFAASERREDGLVKLLVGPFDQEALARAREQLTAQGIESFPR